MIIVKLFLTFFVIGLFNFGGGGAMISLIQAQVVTTQGWLTQSQFTNIVAISQMTPGPIGINCATYTGYQVAGVAGSAAATLAVVLPTFLVFFALVRIFDKFHTHPIFTNIMKALKPAVAGLLGAAAVVMSFNTGMDGLLPQASVIPEIFPDWKACLLFVAALAGSLYTKISPITVIIAAGVLGFLIY